MVGRFRRGLRAVRSSAILAGCADWSRRTRPGRALLAVERAASRRAIDSEVESRRIRRSCVTESARQNVWFAADAGPVFTGARCRSSAAAHTWLPARPESTPPHALRGRYRWSALVINPTIVYPVRSWLVVEAGTRLPVFIGAPGKTGRA